MHTYSNNLMLMNSNVEIIVCSKVNRYFDHAHFSFKTWTTKHEIPKTEDTLISETLSWDATNGRDPEEGRNLEKSQVRHQTPWQKDGHNVKDTKQKLLEKIMDE